MAGRFFSERKKLLLMLVFVAAGVLLFALTAGDSPNLAKQCYDQCAKNKQFSRLVPTYPPNMVAQGKSNPMKCECY